MTIVIKLSIRFHCYKLTILGFKPFHCANTSQKLLRQQNKIITTKLCYSINVSPTNELSNFTDVHCLYCEQNEVTHFGWYEWGGIILLVMANRGSVLAYHNDVTVYAPQLYYNQRYPTMVNTRSDRAAICHRWQRRPSNN